MSRIQPTAEANVAPSAVPTSAPAQLLLSSQDELLPGAYRAEDQGWLFIRKSSTGQKLQRVNPQPVDVRRAKPKGPSSK